MTDWVSIFRQAAASDAPMVSMPPWQGCARFDAFDSEYDACERGAGLADRTYRGLLEVTGKDRAGWLHNLTTNHIARLKTGEGTYAFALDSKGRILFDMNVLVLADRIWLDLDIRWLDRARAHFEKYKVIEDVTVSDRTSAFLRLSLMGSGAGGVLALFGPSNVAIAPHFQVCHLTIEGADVACFRHDLCGVPATDLLVPAESAEPTFGKLRACPEVTLVGYDAVNAHRIESAVPWPVSEINDSVLPGETGQTARAVSIDKGCYLGQEIVERMRTRGSLARHLVLIRCDGETVPEPGGKLRVDNEDVGHVTSACIAPKHRAPLALAYARPAESSAGARVRIEWADGATDGHFVPRPDLR